MKKNKTLFLLKLMSLSTILLFSSCDEETVTGCMDNEACNFNINATQNDTSTCTYAQQNRDCEGNCLVDIDCAGNCGGTIIEDCTGECGGTATLDCNDECGGTAALDCNDECGGTATLDCTGTCGGTAVYDDCGICDGPGPNENGCCEGDAGCTGDCDDSYIDCSGRCCQPTVYNECLGMLSSNTQTTFCADNFASDADLLSQCETLNVITLDNFCQLQFDCASIDCTDECSGGNTGLPNYQICDCFEPEAANYWCNDGGQCPGSGSSVESSDALPCQDECIYGVAGSYIPINPADGYIDVYNDLSICCFTECSDSSAANYDANCTVDTGCQTTNYLKIGQITESTIEILINSSDTLGGFQFNVSGAQLSSVSGGVIDNDFWNNDDNIGMDVSNGSNMVLGFSLSGATIPSTNGEELILTTITYANPDGSTICLPNSNGELIITDSFGNAINNYIIHYQSVCE